VKSDGGTLIVGNNGQLDANIAVGNAQINGTVNGDITATDRIQLGRTARVVGNVSTPKLIIEDGAIFEGGCTMLKARESADKQSKSAYSSTPPAAASGSYSGSSSSSTASTPSTSTPAISKADDSSSTSTAAKTETAKV
jgi:cytoskeletal protein CcmA (bactofilin family)